MYAILSHGGRQYRVSAGDRLVVDRLDAAVGSVLGLEPVLLTGGDDEMRVGKDVDGMRVAVTVVAHLRGKKLRIFKYKPKKRYRRMAGYRSDLTEVRVESILLQGAALPEASAPIATAAAEAEETEFDTGSVATAPAEEADIADTTAGAPEVAPTIEAGGTAAEEETGDGA